MDANALLMALYRAGNQAERDELLARLLTEQVKPIIRSIVRRRVGNTTRQNPDNVSRNDLEDLQAEILKRIYEQLLRIEAKGRPHSIQSFRNYCIGIAVNACNDYWRKKFPVTANLRDTLRELLSKDKEFRIWRSVKKKSYCGLSVWRQEEASKGEQVTTEDIVDALQQRRTGFFSIKRNSSPSIADLVREIFYRAGRPMEFDILVACVAGILRLSDPAVISLEQPDALQQDSVAGNTSVPGEALSNQELLRLFWKELQRLPREQRITIALSFSNQNGEDLFSLLLGETDLPVEELQRELDLSEMKFKQLWEQLPIKDASALAEYLNATVAQIRKWRYQGWKQLRSEMKKYLHAPK